MDRGNIRLEWVDIFKGLLILSVVVGHSTGLFNIYIYQFHMAAFFFISGFTSRLNEKSMLETIWTKFFTLLLPLLTLVIIFILAAKLIYLAGLYPYLFETANRGIFFSILKFFQKGAINVNWLGWTWFIVTLFGVFITQKIILLISKNRINCVSSILSVLLYAAAYWLVHHKIMPGLSFFKFDLIFIAQFYFYAGLFASYYDLAGKLIMGKYLYFCLFAVSLTVLVIFGLSDHMVDYPSRKFGFIIANCFAGLNGIIFSFSLSAILSLFPYLIKNIIVYIGKNTLGILVFHLMFFKIGYAILILAGIVPLAYLKTFVPTTPIGNEYWWLITGTSVVTSIFLYRLLLRLRIPMFLLGSDRISYSRLYPQFYNRMPGFIKKLG